jgi:hypothetical protein
VSTVFDPDLDGTSDLEWLELVERASGGRYFTENQLYLAYARGRVQVTRYIARRGGLGLVMIVLGLATWIYALKVDWGITLVLGIAVTLGGVACVGTGVVTRRDPVARQRVADWLAKWQARKPLERLVSGPTLGHAGLEYRPTRVDALIVVERDTVTDLLLKNFAHAELSALIIAESGYPEALLPEVRRVLDERSDLRVILIHDATTAGVAMRGRVQDGKALPLAGRTLVDAGLFPADVLYLAELAPAIPAGHTSQVPLDSLSYDTLVMGLRGVMGGALSLFTGIGGADAVGGAGAETGGGAHAGGGAGADGGVRGEP